MGDIPVMSLRCAACFTPKTVTTDSGVGMAFARGRLTHGRGAQKRRTGPRTLEQHHMKNASHQVCIQFHPTNLASESKIRAASRAAGAQALRCGCIVRVGSAMRPRLHAVEGTRKHLQGSWLAPGERRESSN
jgi:hypothetical protein